LASIRPISLTSWWLSSDIRFWSSGDTKTGPPDGLLMGAFRRRLDLCFIGGFLLLSMGATPKPPVTVTHQEECASGGFKAS
jgi:hypothetical protein